MRLNHITLAALGMVCAAAFANRSSLQAYGETPNKRDVPRRSRTRPTT